MTAVVKYRLSCGARNKPSGKSRNDDEGLYEGLLLVESAY